jgi:hypothetical protein
VRTVPPAHHPQGPAAVDLRPIAQYKPKALRKTT